TADLVESAEACRIRVRLDTHNNVACAQYRQLCSSFYDPGQICISSVARYVCGSSDDAGVAAGERRKSGSNEAGTAGYYGRSIDQSYCALDSAERILVQRPDSICQGNRTESGF